MGNKLLCNTLTLENIKQKTENNTVTKVISISCAFQKLQTDRGFNEILPLLSNSLINSNEKEKNEKNNIEMTFMFADDLYINKERYLNNDELLDNNVARDKLKEIREKWLNENISKNEELKNFVTENIKTSNWSSWTNNKKYPFINTFVRELATKGKSTYLNTLREFLEKTKKINTDNDAKTLINILGMPLIRMLLDIPLLVDEDAKLSEFYKKKLNLIEGVLTKKNYNLADNNNDLIDLGNEIFEKIDFSIVQSLVNTLPTEEEQFSVKTSDNKKIAGAKIQNNFRKVVNQFSEKSLKEKKNKSAGKELVKKIQEEFLLEEASVRVLLMMDNYDVEVHKNDLDRFLKDVQAICNVRSMKDKLLFFCFKEHNFWLSDAQPSLKNMKDGDFYLVGISKNDEISEDEKQEWKILYKDGKKIITLTTSNEASNKKYCLYEYAPEIAEFLEKKTKEDIESLGENTLRKEVLLPLIELKQSFSLSKKENNLLSDNEEIKKKEKKRKQKKSSEDDSDDAVTMTMGGLKIKFKNEKIFTEFFIKSAHKIKEIITTPFSPNDENIEKNSTKKGNSWDKKTDKKNTRKSDPNTISQPKIVDINPNKKYYSDGNNAHLWKTNNKGKKTLTDSLNLEFVNKK